MKDESDSTNQRQRLRSSARRDFHRLGNHNEHGSHGTTDGTRTDLLQPFPIFVFKAVTIITNNPFGQLSIRFSTNSDDNITPKLTSVVSKSWIVPLQQLFVAPVELLT